MKNKIIIYLCLTFFSLLSANAQIETPVKWGYAAKITGKNEATIFLKAEINNGWHIYSVNQPDGGPIKTSFKFEKSSNYKLDGKVFEPTPIRKYEKTFGVNVFYFEKE